MLFGVNCSAEIDVAGPQCCSVPVHFILIPLCQVNHSQESAFHIFTSNTRDTFEISLLISCINPAKAQQLGHFTSCIHKRLLQLWQKYPLNKFSEQKVKKFITDCCLSIWQDFLVTCDSWWDKYQGLSGLHLTGVAFSCWESLVTYHNISGPLPLTNLIFTVVKLLKLQEIWEL